MTKIRDGFDLEVLKSQLEIISWGMQAGHGDSYYKIKEFLRPYKGSSLFELSHLMSSPVFSTMWHLTTLINELEDNFGYDTVGYPIKEGEPRVISIIENLGHYIKDSIFSPVGSTGRFDDALANYAELVRIVSNSEVSSRKAKDWNKL